MPALSNPRHEAFAQAIFAGLAGKTRIERAQSTAYLKAYPNCSSGNSAEACASKLLRNAKPILDRVRELQAESMARQQHSIDLSRDRAGRDLDLAFRTALLMTRTKPCRLSQRKVYARHRAQVIAYRRNAKPACGRAI